MAGNIAGCIVQVHQAKGELMLRLTQRRVLAQGCLQGMAFRQQRICLLLERLFGLLQALVMREVALRTSGAGGLRP